MRAVFNADAWGDIPMTGVRGRVIARSLGVVAVVGFAATVFALPMAQVLRRTGFSVAAILMAPVWIPAWLIYAGLNLARAPDTLVGGAFMDWALPDHRGVIVALGRAIAICSMALWSAPIAALAMTGVEDPAPTAAEDVLRLERVGILARLSVWLRLRWGAIRVGFVVTVLITIGSAVPLHLAQVETDAITLWRALSERTPDRWGGVWLAAWPEVLIACVGSWWIARRLGARGTAGQDPCGASGAPSGFLTRCAAWGVWSLGCLAPVLLMAGSLESLSSIGHWLAFDRGALWTSAWISGLGAVPAAVLSIVIAGSACSEHRYSRIIAHACAVAALFGAVMPGVLIGAAIARMGLDPVLASVAACSARVAFIGALAGLIVARSEPRDEHSARVIDASGDSIGWIRANRARALRLAGGVWLGSFVIGLHEVEASVMVRPPGTGNLPQQMLSDLHYARLEQLSAGGVVLGLLGIGLGILAGLLLRIGHRQPRPNGAVRPSV